MTDHDVALFKDISCLSGEPYLHQVRVLRLLRVGRPVLLHAPTGSGKSEAAFVPFVILRGEADFPSRLIYVLPTRALVDSLADRFQMLTKKRGLSLRVAAQHGRRPESVLFYANAVVATIDQVISSYVCAPLSLGVRHGNIPAGAVATGFLVLDEVHTLDPRRGLQSALILASRLKRMGLPFLVMTATLPRKARELLQERLGMEVVEVKDADVPVRARRKVTLEMALDRPLTAEGVLKAWREHGGRILVVCNTVDRAITVYEAVKGEVPPENRLLLHSRFLEEDRESCDQRVRELLGKKAGRPALVVATQVVEVGLDISCDLLLTELCPVDALVQRAGRCARWAETPGTIKVFGLPKEGGREMVAPYERDLVERTGDRLSRLSPGERARLSWEIENKLVDEVLGESYAEWLDFQQAGSAAAALAKAVFTGSRNAAAAAVRDNDSVDVSLHTCPESYRGRLRSFPTVQVSVGRLRALVKEHPGSVWALQDENADHRLERPVLVREPGEIQFGRRYFVSSHTCYSAEVGLVFQGPGENWEPHVSGERRQLIRTSPHLETLEEHLLRSLEYFRRLVRIQEGYALQRLAGSTGLAQDDVERLVTMALISHDLGKATREWQKAAWDTVELWLEEDPRHEELLTPEEHCLLSQDRSQTFLARFPSLSDPFREPRRPPHATVSAYAVWELFVRLWDGLGEAAALAVAHHHSVRAAEVPRYQLKPEWLEHFAGLLRTEAGIEVRREDFIEARRSTTELEPRMPPFHREIQYTVYLVVSRCLSLSDRMAAGGGEDAILDFEKWTGSL